jgi:hypothetical protein
MVFTSVGVEIKLPPGTGPYCFQIHGQTYHCVSLFYPSNAISHNMDNFIFFILLKQQTGSKTNQIKMQGQNTATTGQDDVTC